MCEAFTLIPSYAYCFQRPGGDFSKGPDWATQGARDFAYEPLGIYTMQNTNR